MHRLFTIIGVAAFAVAGLSASSFAAQSPDGLLPSVLTIHIKDFKFNPTPATIHVGDRVTFINDDEEAHTATAADKSFDSEGLDAGRSWQHVFTKPGTYRYFCELHPSMKATILVAPGTAENKENTTR